MWISNLNIIPTIKNPLAGGTPPVSYFIISENAGDILEMEANTDQMVSEAAP